MLDPADTIAPNPARATGEVIDGEAIVINLETGAYYSTQGVGGRIWSMIEARASVGAMLEQIQASYEVAAEDAARDLQALLGELLKEGLVLVTPRNESPLDAAEPAAGTTAAPPAKLPYTRPSLEIFRDMEELLALDPPAPGMNEISWQRDIERK